MVAEEITPVEIPRYGICLADVTEKKIHWRSRGRLAKGKVTDLSGDPGKGKTMVLLDWTARISRGEELPDGEPSDQRHVVYMSIEDDLDDTLVPRLRIAGADLSYITALYKHPDTGKFLTLPTDAEVVIQVIRAMDAALVVVDPMLGFMDRGLSANSGEDIRTAYQPIVDGIKESGTSVVMVRHLNKNTSVTNAAYRGAGSSQITAVARVGMTVAQSATNPNHRILAQNKENLTERVPSLAFELQSIPGEDHPRVHWIGETYEDADELMRSDEEKEADAEAIKFLQELLEVEPVSSGEVWRLAGQQKISERALKSAKKKLRVVHDREGFGAETIVYWGLPVKKGLEDFPLE